MEEVVRRVHKRERQTTMIFIRISESTLQALLNTYGYFEFEYGENLKC